MRYGIRVESRYTKVKPSLAFTVLCLDKANVVYDPRAQFWTWNEAPVPVKSASSEEEGTPDDPSYEYGDVMPPCDVDELGSSRGRRVGLLLLLLVFVDTVLDIRGAPPS